MELAQKAQWRSVVLSNTQVIVIALLVLVPLVANLPTLSGFFNPDPIGPYGGLSTHVVSSRVPGLSFIDPNIGPTSQALGHRAALDWLQGRIPWWNPYEGVGVPLAGEMQSAALFPLTLLLYFSNGQLYFRIILQIIAGISTYFLLRCLVPSQLAAAVGGILFELNGTFAWFGHAPINPVAFLPLLLLGVEDVYNNARQGARYGWRWIAIAIALSLYAGFPEIAYIDSIFAIVWVALRASQLRPPALWSYLVKIAIGGVMGLLLAAPILVAFFNYFGEAFVGSHAGALAFAYIPPAALPLLVYPYFFGPIFSFLSFDPTGQLGVIWGNIGGYLTASLLLLLLVGLLGKRERALRFVLFGWIILALAKTFGVSWVAQVLNGIPFMPLTAFYRYSPPSWEMAAIILVAFALDDSIIQRPRRIWLAAIVTFLILIASIIPAHSLEQTLSKAPHFTFFQLISILWASFVLIAIGTSFFAQGKARTALIGTFLIVDALTMFMAPMLSNPRSFQVDRPAIQYLREHLGLARFYTLGPFAPNYGSYFGLASINHNDLPIAARWVKYINKDLDSNANPVSFTGNASQNPSGKTPEEALCTNLENYKWIGVKFVLTQSNGNPFKTLHNQPKLVYHDEAMNIYELPDYQPYFTTLQKTAELHVVSRTKVHVRCTKPTLLIRRELFFPGWHANINGKEIPIMEYRGLFQSVHLSQGESTLSFRYVPQYMEYAGASFGVAVLLLFGTMFLPRRRYPEKTQIS